MPRRRMTFNRVLVIGAGISKEIFFYFITACPKNGLSQDIWPLLWVMCLDVVEHLDSFIVQYRCNMYIFV